MVRQSSAVAGRTRVVLPRRRQPAPACVLGDSDLVRALGLGGIRTAVVAPPGAPVTYSRHTTSVIGPLDHWRQAEALASRLLEWASDQTEPPVLYFQTDGDLLMVSRHRKRLAEAFRFVIADEELVEDLVDKGRFRSLAERLDLPVPPAVVMRAGATLADIHHVSLPVVVKPLTRAGLVAFHTAGGKAIEIRSSKQLTATMRVASEAGVDVLVQQLIPGPESRIESYHAYVAKDGETVAEFTGAKIRTYPVAMGETTALEITDRNDVRRIGRSVVARLGLRGVVKVDFKRDDAGRLWLLEVNPRFNLWHHPGAAAGANLPALVYADLVGVPRSAAVRAKPGVTWIHPYHDRWAAREVGVPRAEWLRAVLSSRSRWASDWADPMPIVRGLLLPRLRQRWSSRRTGSSPGAAS